MDYCNTQKICCVPERRAQKGAFKAPFLCLKNTASLILKCHTNNITITILILKGEYEMANNKIEDGILSDDGEFYIKNGKKYYKTKNGKFMNENSLKNLDKLYDENSLRNITPEQRKKGQEKSKATQKRRREIKKDLDYILSLPTKKQTEILDIENINSYEDLLKCNSNQQVAILAALILRAKDGDVKSIELICRMLGELTPEKKEINIVSEAQNTMGNVLKQLEKRNDTLDDNKDGE